MAHFVLDQNFPWQATTLPWPPSIIITPLYTYDASLTSDHDDWEVLSELQRRGDVDGFITNDANMLALKREMVILHDSRLTLVIAGRFGHQPIPATGLIMTYLPQIAAAVSGGPQVFQLNPAPIATHRKRPYDHLERLATREGISVQTLIRAERALIARGQ